MAPTGTTSRGLKKRSLAPFFGGSLAPFLVGGSSGSLGRDKKSTFVLVFTFSTKKRKTKDLKTCP